MMDHDYDKHQGRKTRVTSYKDIIQRREKLCVAKIDIEDFKKSCKDLKFFKKTASMVAEILMLCKTRYPDKRLHQSQIAEILDCKHDKVTNCMGDVKDIIFKEHGLGVSNKEGIGYKIATIEEALEEMFKSQKRSVASNNYAEKMHFNSSYDFKSEEFMTSDLYEMYRASKMFAIVMKGNDAITKELMSEYQELRSYSKEREQEVLKPVFRR